jgi:hypothetical protein
MNLKLCVITLYVKELNKKNLVRFKMFKSVLLLYKIIKTVNLLNRSTTGKGI